MALLHLGLSSVIWVLFATTFQEYKCRRAESPSGFVCSTIVANGNGSGSEEYHIRCGRSRQPCVSDRPYGSRTVLTDVASDVLLQGGQVWWEAKLKGEPRLVRMADTGICVLCDRHEFNDSFVSCEEPAIVAHGADGTVIRSWILSDLVMGKPLIEVRLGVRSVYCEWLIDLQPAIDGKTLLLIVDRRPIVRDPPGGLLDLEVLKLRLSDGACERATQNDVIQWLRQADPAIRRMGCIAALIVAGDNGQEDRLRGWPGDGCVDDLLDTCVCEISRILARGGDADELSPQARSWLLMENHAASGYNGIEYGCECIYPRAVCLRALVGTVPSRARLQLLAQWIEATRYDKAACAIIGTWGVCRTQDAMTGLASSSVDPLRTLLEQIKNQSVTHNPLWD